MADKKAWSLVGEGFDAFVSCPVPEGWSFEIVQGVQVAIPPEGYVKDPFGSGMVYLGVDKKNPEPDDFYWVRQGLPKDYADRLREESIKRQEDPDFSDPYIEAFRQGAWIRRLSGCWFANGPKGTPTYISGLHYFYMEWCFIAAHGNKGYPSYRSSDRDFFLFIEHINRNPHCFGALLLTKRREGKALAIDTPIPTPGGFVNMGDLKEGDTVFDENGSPCKVTFATQVMHGRKCYRVTFDDGASVIADAEHQWAVIDTHKHDWDNYNTIATTEEIKNNIFSIQIGERYFIHVPSVSEERDPLSGAVSGITVHNGRSRIRRFSRIEPINSVPVRCIEVDSPSHLYLATRDYIVTHNTQKSVAFGLEAVTRSGYGNFGIQSKTAEDAAKVVFKDSAIRMFARLPDFFKPVHDDRRLMNISNTLIFKPKQTDVSTFKENRFLGGWVEHRSSTETAFDGTKLLRYVGDEVFKTQVGVDVYERWNVVKFCLIVDGKVRGKAMLTSTVEEIEGSTDMYIKVYADSDQRNIDEIGRTRTGLFRFFLPADEARNRDKYGHCDKDKNREEILLERKAYAGDTMTYNSLVRKEPLTVEEAFRFLSKDSIFDTIKISDQIDLVAWRQDELLERGNYVWKTYGEEVLWVPTQKGRWVRVRNYPHPVVPLSEPDAVNYKTDFQPKGTHRYVCGIDPFSHSRVEGRQKSDGAFYVKRKNDPLDPDHSDMFVLQYLYRTSEVEQFYEDVFITLFTYGCLGLIENNKIGMVGYFENERVQNFLMKIKGQKNYGIAATKRTTQAICEMIEKYIYESIGKVYFVELLKDWANFDIDDTQEFDAAMASGYTLLADSKILLRKSPDKALKIIEIGDLL